MHYLIIGNGGIGHALRQTLLNQQHQVTMFTRQTLSAQDTIQVDVTEPTQVDAAIEQMAQLPDWVINTVGFLHDADHLPEKSAAQFCEENLYYSLHINTFPTLYLTQALSKHMTSQTNLRFVSFSARVSSIDDNQLGGWYSYRISKCALNMLVKNISLEWRRRFRQAAIYTYHPGTVATPLSEPFSANVPKQKLFTPMQAANYCLEVLAQRNLAESGLLFDWQGKRIVF